jgi:hypothetical protein
VIGVAAAGIAWLGACLIVLADGRRGLAAGLGLATAGLSWLAWQSGAGWAVAAIVAGGAVGSYQRLRSGPAGWQIMPPGSTPRLVLCIAAGLVGLWFALSVTSGSGSAVRFASLVSIGMLGIRIVTSRPPQVVLTSVGGFAIAIALATCLEPGTPGLAAFMAAGVITAGASLFGGAEPKVA